MVSFKDLRSMKTIYKQTVFILVAAVMAVSNPLAVYAAPSFTNFPTSTSHYSASQVKKIGGDLWYFQSTTSSPSVRHIGRMTTSGTMVNYDIPALTGKPTLVVSSITAGSDGNVWFNGRESTSVFIGRIDITTGAVTLYATGVSSNITSEIAASSDGKLWFYSKFSGWPPEALIQKFDISTGTTTTAVTLDTYANLTGITTGHDGRIWLTDAYYKRIYALNTTSSSMSSYNVTPVTGSITWLSSITAGPGGDMWVRTNSAVYKFSIASSTLSLYTPPIGVPAETIPIAGSDGANWFMDTVNKKLVRASVAGNVTTYTVPGSSIVGFTGLVAGPDEAMWFSYSDSTGRKLGRLVVEPDFTNFPASTSHYSPSQMTVIGGDLWYVQDISSTNHIGRMSPSGVVTNYDIPALVGYSNFVTRSITKGPDGNLWFNGRVGSSVLAGKLDITTGTAITYGTWVSGNNLGAITTGSDGSLWYYNKYDGAPANTYLIKLDPSTGVTTTVATFDTYTNLTGIAAGSDGRIWLTDTYYKRIYARNTTGSSGSDYNTTPVMGTYSYLGSLSSGPGGHLWMRADDTVYKFVIGTGLSAYSPPAGTPMKAPISGYDGMDWYIDSSVNKIGRISNTGAVKEYTVPGTSVALLNNLTAGPGEAMWFTYTEAGVKKVGRLGY